MRLKSVLSLVTACCVVTTSVANGATLFFDFGERTQTTAGNYNNVTQDQEPIFNAVDSLGNGTGISMTTSGFNPGSNQNGTLTPGSPADQFDAQATRDNLFGHTAAFNQPQALPVGTLALAGLDPNATYNFTFFGARLGVSNNRETRYDVAGLNTITGLLNTSNNTSDVAVVMGISPTAAGTITVSVAPGPANDDGSGFYYLGAMRIDSGVIPEPTTIALFAFSGVALILKRSRQ
jgi:hypothetical protein